MRDFYTAFYSALPKSRADAVFCEHAYGKNLCQHGFVTMEQLALLLAVTRMSPRARVLDLGCGNGMITDYVRAQTGAQVVGVDNIFEAIEQAWTRTAQTRACRVFLVADLNQTPFAPHSFDVLLSLDTIYFSNDYTATVCAWKMLLCPGGQMLLFYSHGANPETPKEIFCRETLPPVKTPLAEALRANGLDFKAIDLTFQDYELARRKKEILATLKPQYESEGNQFLYENRIGEAVGVMEAVESGMHARYLYLVNS